METDILTFLIGAGSAGTVVGSIILYRIKKSWDSLDEIPKLILKVDELDTTVKSFSGELKAIERTIYENQKDIAIAGQKVQAAFREFDGLKETIREMKL